MKFLRRHGWTVRVEPFIGYGTPHRVRVLARAVLAPAATRDAELPDTSAPARPARRRAVRGWRTFATAQVADAILEAEVAGTVHRLVADRGGYVDALLPVDLSPGWHDVHLSTSDGRTGTVPVLVVGPGTTAGIVSDIDDTVMVTRVPRLFVAAWNVLVRRDTAREPVPGMAGLYRELLAGRTDVPVVYVSTGAWNAAPAIGGFLRRHGFPVGPLLLTDWGPTNTGWFRSGPEHKKASLARLLAELPQVRWTLVGDDGQRDPQIYAELARAHPERVRAVVIRELTSAEHVLAHGAPVPLAGATREEGVARSDHVPLLRGPDGGSIARDWRVRGLSLD